MAPQLFPRKTVDWARFGSKKAVKATTAPQFFRRFGKKKIIKNDYRAQKKKTPRIKTSKTHRPVGEKLEINRSKKKKRVCSLPSST